VLGAIDITNMPYGSETTLQDHYASSIPSTTRRGARNRLIRPPRSPLISPQAPSLKSESQPLAACVQRSSLIPSKILLEAISPEADKVAVLSKNMFWVFNISSGINLNCIGQFKVHAWARNPTYLYASEDSDPKTQLPIPDTSQIADFSCAALSSEYLAVGCPGNIMIYIVVGTEQGRWVTSNTSARDNFTLVERLVFSPDGRQLLALVKTASGFKALIYSTDQFPKDSFERLKNVKPIPVAASAIPLAGVGLLYRPSGVAFGFEGTMVAICTSHIDSKGLIILLKKMADCWRVWYLAGIAVCDSRDPTQALCEGFTGISLYYHLICDYLSASSHQDSYLVLSIDSKYGPACDRFRIIASDDGLRCRLQSFKRFYTPEGQKTISLAVSQRLNGVVLMNFEGISIIFLLIRVGELFLKKSGVEQTIPVQRQSTRRTIIGHRGEVSAMSFSNAGTRLVLVDNYVQTSRSHQSN
jgi:hypothetical protein